MNCCADFSTLVSGRLKCRISQKAASKVIDCVILNFLPARLADGVSGSQRIVYQIQK